MKVLTYEEKIEKLKERQERAREKLKEKTLLKQKERSDKPQNVSTEDLKQKRYKGTTTKNNNLKTKKKSKSQSSLIKELDTLYSIYIRQKNSKDGYCTCVTCGCKKYWKEMQNGHYYSRSFKVLRWDDRNCNVQCVVCNVFNHGNYPKYALFMIDKYGEKVVREMEIETRKICKLSTVELTEKIEYYKEINKNFNK